MAISSQLKTFAFLAFGDELRDQHGQHSELASQLFGFKPWAIEWGFVYLVN